MHSHLDCKPPLRARALPRHGDAVAALGRHCLQALQHPASVGRRRKAAPRSDWPAPAPAAAHGEVQQANNSSAIPNDPRSNSLPAHVQYEDSSQILD